MARRSSADEWLTDVLGRRDLSATAKLAAVAIGQAIDRSRTGRATLSQREIADIIGIASARRPLRELQQKGLIFVVAVRPDGTEWSLVPDQPEPKLPTIPDFPEDLWK